MATVLIVGGGAREHALSRAYEQSKHVKRIIVAPGNDFIRYKRDKEVILEKSCDVRNIDSILEAAKKYKPDLVDVAQDDALAGGAVDLLTENGFLSFGPSKKKSKIEWDKRFSREFMRKHKIPCPRFRYFNDEGLAKEYAKKVYSQHPEKILWVKAVGLCGGKGALKARSLDEVIDRIERMKTFGEAGNGFLIEGNLVGEEFSYYAMSDGCHYVTFKSAQDNKNVYAFDQGDMTGGMGANSPALVTKGREHEIEQKQIAPLIDGLWNEGTPYVGIIYLGGIIGRGEPKNIEYNARWGDPEAQVVLPSVKNDYFELVMACLESGLDKVKLEQDDLTRVCIVGASKGYPGNYSAVMGKRIYGIEEAMRVPGTTVLGAAITSSNGKFYANGERLFSIVAEGKDIIEAKHRAYSAMAYISIDGNNLQFRPDIGWRDVERFCKKEF